MKRMLALTLAMLMCLSVIVACGKADPDQNTTATPTAASAEDTTAQTTPAETTHPEETRDLTVEKYDRDFVIFQAGNWATRTLWPRI